MKNPIPKKISALHQFRVTWKCFYIRDSTYVTKNKKFNMKPDTIVDHQDYANSGCRKYHYIGIQYIIYGQNVIIAARKPNSNDSIKIAKIPGEHSKNSHAFPSHAEVHPKLPNRFGLADPLPSWASRFRRPHLPFMGYRVLPPTPPDPYRNKSPSVGPI